MKKLIALLCGLLSSSFLYSADGTSDQMDDLKKTAADDKSKAAWQKKVENNPEHFVGALFKPNSELTVSSSVMDFVVGAQEKFKKDQESRACCSLWICCPREVITRGTLFDDGREEWAEETVGNTTIPLAFKGFSRASSCCGQDTTVFSTLHPRFEAFAKEHTEEQLAFIQKLHQQALHKRMKEKANNKVFEDLAMRRDSDGDAKKDAASTQIVLDEQELRMYQGLDSQTQLNLVANFNLVESGGKKIKGPELAARHSVAAVLPEVTGAVAASAAARIGAAVRPSAGSTSGGAGSNATQTTGIALGAHTGGGGVHAQQPIPDSAHHAAALHDDKNRRRSSSLDSEHHGEQAYQVIRVTMAGEHDTQSS